MMKSVTIAFTKPILILASSSATPLSSRLFASKGTTAGLAFLSTPTKLLVHTGASSTCIFSKQKLEHFPLSIRTYSSSHIDLPQSSSSLFNNKSNNIDCHTNDNINDNTNAAETPSQSKSQLSMTDKQTLHVVSYNLLSSHLADPSHHTKSHPQHLQATGRFPKILAKLQAEIDKKHEPQQSSPIFCLQEVSHDWAKQLHVFFAERGYHFITALYGNHYSGYMGIGTAYSIEHFKTLDVDICRLSDVREGGWPRPREGIDDTNEGGIVSKYVFNPLVNTAKYLGLLQHKPIIDPWEKSQYRNNQFIAVQLQQRQKGDDENNNGGKSLQPFWIGNYHMPCAFRYPAVMTIHCDLVAHRIQSLASRGRKENQQTLPYILAGDFNILPDSPQYQLLTTGALDDNDNEREKSNSPFPPIKYGVKWETSCKKMKSAYAMYNSDGKESDFTNYAHNGALSDESFIGTLDYIFLSEDHDWKVSDVAQLRHRSDVEDGPFPNESEPSDHVLIAATLEV